MKWTKEQEAEIVKLYRNGWKIKDISQKTGIGVTAIKSKLQKLRKKGVMVERWWKPKND